MLERIVYVPEDPDHEPSINISLPEGVEVSLRRTNSAVYSYIGNLAVFNHMYFLGDDKTNPFYIFREFTPRPQFEALITQMIKYKFPYFMNQAWVDEADIETFETHARNQDQDSLEDIVKNWANDDKQT